jgi:integrase
MAYVYTTAGVRKRRPVYGRTFEEVRDKLARLQGNSASGVLVPDRAVTVGEYLEVWIARVKENKRATTWRGYESAVRLHIVPVLGRRKLERLTAGDVRQLITVCRSKCLCCVNGYDKHRAQEEKCCSVGKCCGRHPSTRQIQFIHAVLRNALGSAMRDEVVTRNVAKLVEVPAPRYKVGKGLKVAEVKRLLGAAEGDRLYAVYVVAATLGLRRGELLGLHWQDIDLDRATLTVAKTVQRVGGELLVDDTKSEA